MFRLILLILFVAAIVVAALATVTVVYSVTRLAKPQPRTGEDKMPQTFQRIAYIALVVLLIGITSGWLGGV